MEKAEMQEKVEPEQLQERFTLKHNGKLQEVGYEELIALAQKGLDYDRIRTDRDLCRQKLAEMAAGEGKEEAQLPIMPMDLNNSAETEEDLTRKESAEDKEGVLRREEFARLLSEYPEVRRYGNFEALPEGFVEGLTAGMSPIEAWQRYLLDKQKLKLAMMERENKNRLAAAPDVRSSGRYDEDGFVKALFGR